MRKIPRVPRERGSSIAVERTNAFPASAGTDTELLAAAIAVATPGNVSAFSRLLGHKSPGRTFAWLAGTRPTPPWVVLISRLIVGHPEVAGWLMPDSL